MIHINSVLNARSVLVTAALSLLAPGSRAQGGVTLGDDGIIDLSQPSIVRVGKDYKIPRAIWAANDLNTQGQVYSGPISIGGQQGGNWTVETVLGVPEFILFNPTSECEAAGFGLCEYVEGASSSDPLAARASFRVRLGNIPLPSVQTFAVSVPSGSTPVAIDLTNRVNLQLNFNESCSQISQQFVGVDAAYASAVSFQGTLGDPSDTFTMLFTPPPGTPACGRVTIGYFVRNCCVESDRGEITINFTAPPSVVAPAAIGGAFRFRAGDPYLIPLNGIVVPGSLALGNPPVSIDGQQGGSFAYLPGSGGSLGQVSFGPNFTGCGMGSVTLRAVDECGTMSAPVVVDVHIDPPLADCNQNCIPDTSEPDVDGDGLPDDCAANSSLPGSLLLVPLVDNRPHAMTLITVTDVEPFAGAPKPGTSVDLEFVYVRRYSDSGSDVPCSRTGRTVRMTAGDTFSVRTDSHVPNGGVGFAYIFAKDPATGAAISWNRLIGSELFFDAVAGSGESLQLVSFRAVGEQGVTTDQDDDGVRDLDGSEYTAAPLELLVPRFLGQDEAPDPVFDGRLILIGLSAGAQHPTLVGLEIYDDDEVLLSDQVEFTCWDMRALADISGGFTNEYLRSVGDIHPGLGGGQREAGWVRLRGEVSPTDPAGTMQAIYAVLLERAAGTCVADLPFEYGVLPTGSLLEP